MKSAFTRECNKDTRVVRSGILLPDAKKKRKTKVCAHGVATCPVSHFPTPHLTIAASQVEDDVDEEEDEDEEAGEEEEEEPDLKHDPKRLAMLQKRGIQLDLKAGVSVAKPASKAAGKGKAAVGKGAAGKGKKAV